MNLASPFVRRPIGTSLVAIGILLCGALGYSFLPVVAMLASCIALIYWPDQD